MTTHAILTGDSSRIGAVPDGSVQLVFTSPPYPMIEMWDGMFASQDRRIAEDLANGRGTVAFERMHSLLDAVWSECDRVLADNGFICINIGDATRTVDDEFCLYPNHVRIVDYFLGKGYSVLPDILWRKPSNAPNKFMGSGMFPAGAYVTYEHEYILVFRKGGKRSFKGRQRELRKKSAFFWEERNVWFSDLWEIKGTSQSIKIDNGGRDRNASFPFAIPYRIVNMYSAEGDTVLDPFAGLGTTNLACMVANRNSIGVEIDPSIAKAAVENLQVPVKELNRVIDGRLRRHCEFIESLNEEKRAKCYFCPAHQFLVKTRQETGIRIERLSSVRMRGNTVVCTYADNEKRYAVPRAQDDGHLQAACF